MEHEFFELLTPIADELGVGIPLLSVIYFVWKTVTKKITDDRETQKKRHEEQIEYMKLMREQQEKRDREVRKHIVLTKQMVSEIIVTMPDEVQAKITARMLRTNGVDEG